MRALQRSQEVQGLGIYCAANSPMEPESTRESKPAPRRQCRTCTARCLARRSPGIIPMPKTSCRRGRHWPPRRLLAIVGAPPSYCQRSMRKAEREYGETCSVRATGKRALRSVCALSRSQQRKIPFWEVVFSVWPEWYIPLLIRMGARFDSPSGADTGKVPTLLVP